MTAITVAQHTWAPAGVSASTTTRLLAVPFARGRRSRRGLLAFDSVDSLLLDNVVVLYRPAGGWSGGGSCEGTASSVQIEEGVSVRVNCCPKSANDRQVWAEGRNHLMSKGLKRRYGPALGQKNPLVA